MNDPGTAGSGESRRTRGPWLRYGIRLGAALLLLVAVAAAIAIADGWRAFGAGAAGERLARMERSPQWRDGRFVNPQPIVNDFPRMVVGSLHVSPALSPAAPLPVEAIEPGRFATPPESGLRITWFGHSSTLIELDGHRILTDPSWSQRASPLSFAGPGRWYEPPLALADLPPLDAVLISHDHYDHLDYPTIVALTDRVPLFIVPLGVGAHLSYWGVPEEKIVELDWWEQAAVGDLTVTAAPARHASGRFLRQDSTLWASFALRGPRHCLYFSGDTGLFPGMTEIGERLGPFDVALIEVGQYHGSWPDWHIGPEQAVAAQGLLRSKLLFPMHWGLLGLAFHGWTEPIERVVAAARASHVPMVAPRPGQSIEPATAPPVERWWPQVAWETAAQAPIVSSQLSFPGG